MSFELDKIKSIHFVGVKGVAMTALAILAHEKGIRVTGSDVSEKFPTDKTLNRFQILPKTGFKKMNLPDHLDLVIYTGAHQGVQNSEVQEAIKRNIPVLPHGKALGLFMMGKRGITVAGSHGKTTTSAIISHLLVKLGKDPSFAVGCGEIISLRTSGHRGRGEYFVAEGDEYVTDPTSDPTPRFMWQKPEVLVVTNIDFDHPDVYKDLNHIKKVFIDFANSLLKNAVVVVNSDDKASASIIPKILPKVITYGQNESAHYRVKNINFENKKSHFELFFSEKKLTDYTLAIPGVHNIYNAAGALVALIRLGFHARELVRPLSTFIGTKRRFEFWGEKNSKLLYDDYAHHPAEIQATLKAAKKWFPKRRLVAVFQPHTYSRTHALLREFGHSFDDANVVVVTDIYQSARERVIPKVSGQVLFDRVRRFKKSVHFAPKKEDVLQYLRKNTRENDLVLTMGAGDIFTWLPDMWEIF